MDRRRPQKPQGQSPTPNFQAETWKRKSPITKSLQRKNAPEEGNIRAKAPRGAGACRGRTKCIHVRTGFYY